MEGVTAGRSLVASELALVRDIVARRAPDLADAVERIAHGPLDDALRERIRRTVVDELCELPDTAGRHALELEELLIHLGHV